MERLKIKIQPSFWLFIVAAVVLRQGYFAAMYSVAVVMHEAAHYVAASRLFYRCKEIRLDLFGAVLYGEFNDVNGSDRIKIALAGPLCNLCLCLTCLALWWIVPDAYYYTEVFFTANLTMACVNMLPCYPLDGGRVLTGLLEGRLGDKALKVTKIFTVTISLSLFCVFVLSLFTQTKLFNLGIFAIGLFSGVFSTAQQTYERSAMWEKEHFLKNGLEKKTLVFDKRNTLSDVAKRMKGNYLYCLEVVDDNMNIVARYNVAQLERLVLSFPLVTKLCDIRLNPA